jgi:hypothetical protein
VQLVDRCTPLKFTNGAHNVVWKRCSFQRWVPAVNSQAGQP